MDHKSDKVATATCSKKIDNWLLGIGIELQLKGTWIGRICYSTGNKYLMFPLVLMAQLNNEKLSQGFPSLQNFRYWIVVYKAFIARMLPSSVVYGCMSCQCLFDVSRQRFGANQFSGCAVTSATSGSGADLRTVPSQPVDMDVSGKWSGQDYGSVNFYKGCSAVFVARASVIPRSGVPEVW